MKMVSYVSSGLVLVTGIYLTWYWYTAITERSDQAGLLRIFGNWQTAIATQIEEIGALPIAVSCVVVMVISIGVSRQRG
jgi:hypothetical protein